MNAKLFRNKISVRPSKIHNYGVFADKSIKKGALIEEAYGIVAEKNGPYLEDYRFSLGDGRVVFPLGNAMIYNHSSNPNAHYEFYADNLMRITATRFIPKNEEIRIFYSKTWFSARDLTVTELPTEFSWVHNPLTYSLARVVCVSGVLYGLAKAAVYCIPWWTALLMPFQV